MKKILGVFSLIAIMTVSFTVQASASVDTDNHEVVFDIGYDSPDFVAVSVEIVTADNGVFNVADDSVSYTVVKEDTNFAVDTDSYGISYATLTNYDVPIDYGIRGIATNITTTNTITKPEPSSNDNYYTDDESPVGWSKENIIK